jgi:hypothetical protein
MTIMFDDSVIQMVCSFSMLFSFIISYTYNSGIIYGSLYQTSQLVYHHGGYSF